LVLNPLETDVVQSVREATKGGVDVAIDCAGNQRTFDAACGATRAKARIVMVALWDTDKRAALDFSVSCAACCDPTRLG
jgi:threonine dehydrogenase-like Zn-dependent dehydrogenase